MRKLIFGFGILVIISGCAQVSIKLSPDDCLQQGRYIPEGDLPTADDLAKDAYCASVVMQRSAPHGAISIFGSARTKEGDPAYEETRKFAALWTKTEWGKRYPILTGGGPGIMEAGNRGAAEAQGVSLGFGHYFSKGPEERQNPYVNDGYMFASFAQREAELIDRAQAIVVAVGGVGTSWEIFEALTKKQTKKIKDIPIVFLGGEGSWSALLQYIDNLARLKKISPEDRKSFKIVTSAEKAVELLKDMLPLENKGYGR